MQALKRFSMVKKITRYGHVLRHAHVQAHEKKVRVGPKAILLARFLIKKCT
jgi:hypothetical protein